MSEENQDASRSHNMGNLVQGEHPQNSGGIGWGCCSQQKGYYWWLIGSCIRAIDWYQNQRPWMTLNGHFALCVKIHALSEPTTKIWMKIDPYCHCQQQRCSAVIVLSDNIRFMRILAEVPWRRCVIRQRCIRKTSIFGAFGRYVFGILGNEANIII